MFTDMCYFRSCVKPLAYRRSCRQVGDKATVVPNKVLLYYLFLSTAAIAHDYFPSVYATQTADRKCNFPQRGQVRLL